MRFAKKLKALELKGNPLAQDSSESYDDYVIAHLSHLVYLDGKMVTNESRQGAEEKYELFIEEVVTAEKAEQTKLEQEENDLKNLDLQKVTFELLQIIKFS